MAIENHTTYTLPPAEAAALRVPLINYPSDLVPRHVINRCLVDWQVDHDMKVSAVLELIKMQGENK